MVLIFLRVGSRAAALPSSTPACRPAAALPSFSTPSRNLDTLPFAARTHLSQQTPSSRFSLFFLSTGSNSTACGYCACLGLFSSLFFFLFFFLLRVSHIALRDSLPRPPIHRTPHSVSADDLAALIPTSSVGRSRLILRLAFNVCCTPAHEASTTYNIFFNSLSHSRYRYFCNVTCSAPDSRPNDRAGHPAQHCDRPVIPSTSPHSPLCWSSDFAHHPTSRLFDSE